MMGEGVKKEEGVEGESRAIEASASPSVNIFSYPEPSLVLKADPFHGVGGNDDDLWQGGDDLTRLRAATHFLAPTSRREGRGSVGTTAASEGHHSPLPHLSDAGTTTPPSSTDAASQHSPSAGLILLQPHESKGASWLGDATAASSWDLDLDLDLDRVFPSWEMDEFAPLFEGLNEESFMNHVGSGPVSLGDNSHNFWQGTAPRHPLFSTEINDLRQGQGIQPQQQAAQPYDPTNWQNFPGSTFQQYSFAPSAGSTSQWPLLPPSTPGLAQHPLQAPSRHHDQSRAPSIVLPGGSPKANQWPELAYFLARPHFSKPTAQSPAALGPVGQYANVTMRPVATAAAPTSLPTPTTLPKRPSGDDVERIIKSAKMGHGPNQNAQQQLEFLAKKSASQIAATATATATSNESSSGSNIFDPPRRKRGRPRKTSISNKSSSDSPPGSTTLGPTTMQAQAGSQLHPSAALGQPMIVFGKDGKPLKNVGHNAIERRYRNRINDLIADLRDSVPSLRGEPGSLVLLQGEGGAGGPSEGEEEEEEETLGDGRAGRRAGGERRLNKGTILKKATDSIWRLRTEVEDSREELGLLKAVMLAFSGGQDALDRVHEHMARKRALLQQEKARLQQTLATVEPTRNGFSEDADRVSQSVNASRRTSLATGAGPGAASLGNSALTKVMMGGLLCVAVFGGSDLLGEQDGSERKALSGIPGLGLVSRSLGPATRIPGHFVPSIFPMDKFWAILRLLSFLTCLMALFFPDNFAHVGSSSAKQRQAASNHWSRSLVELASEVIKYFVFLIFGLQFDSSTRLGSHISKLDQACGLDAVISSVKVLNLANATSNRDSAIEALSALAIKISRPVSLPGPLQRLQTRSSMHFWKRAQGIKTDSPILRYHLSHSQPRTLADHVASDLCLFYSSLYNAIVRGTCGSPPEEPYNIISTRMIDDRLGKSFWHVPSSDLRHLWHSIVVLAEVTACEPREKGRVEEMNRYYTLLGLSLVAAAIGRSDVVERCQDLIARSPYSLTKTLKEPTPRSAQEEKLSRLANALLSWTALADQLRPVLDSLDRARTAEAITELRVLLHHPIFDGPDLCKATDALVDRLVAEAQEDNDSACEV